MNNYIENDKNENDVKTTNDLSVLPSNRQRQMLSSKQESQETGDTASCIPSRDGQKILTQTQTQLNALPQTSKLTASQVLEKFGKRKDQPREFNREPQEQSWRLGVMNRSPFAARDVDIDPTMSALIGGSMMEEKRHRRKELIQIFRKKHDPLKTTKLTNNKNYMDDIIPSH